MFDAKRIGQVIGRQAFEEIHASSLPKIMTMTLLHVWTHSSEKKLRAMAQAGELLPVLQKQLRLGLEEANEVRMHNSHLTPVECLQVAGLPLAI